MNNRNGFASAQVLGIMVIASLAGAYLLKSASKEASASGSYFQMRTATSSAQAGLSAALTQLEADTAQAMAMLHGYLKDDKREWMLGNKGVTGSPNVVSLPTDGQKYSARILGFDSATGVIKIQAEGKGLGGSVIKVTGIYRLEGLSSDAPAASVLHAFYLAGDNRVVDAAMNVGEGEAYFGGAVQFTANAGGTGFHHSLHIAPSPSNTTSTFNAYQVDDVPGVAFDFDGPALFETPVHVLGVMRTRFLKNTGFQENLHMDASVFMAGAAKSLFTNANFTGTQRLNVAGYSLLHSGRLNVGAVFNAPKITDNGSEIDLSAKTGVPSGYEAPLQVNMSVIPAAQIFTPSQLGLPATVTAKNITDAYNSLTPAQRFGKFMVINVNTPLAFAESAVPAENINSDGVIFMVNSSIAMNSALPKVPGGGNWMFYVPSGGSIADFGGDNYTQGYVHVTGTGSVTYRWRGSNHFHGAIHHVSPESGFRMDGEGLCLTLERKVMQEYTDAGLVGYLPVDGGASAPVLHLTDARIRPALLGLYY